MEEKYCDYTNPKWIDRFEGLKNGRLTTHIEGNTIYIEEFLEPYNEAEYIKYILGLYKKKEKRVTGKRIRVAFLVMCKCHEKTLIEWLESHGFIIKTNEAIHMLSIEEFEKEVVGDELCHYCRYEIDGCKGMTTGGNGEPCYPPCADFSKEIIEEAYEQYVEEYED